MKLLFISPALVLLAGTLSGCGVLFGDDGYFRDRGSDYLKAESIPPLKIPENVNPEVFGQIYVVPDVNAAPHEYPSEFEAPRPPALASSLYSEQVKIQRLGERRWIFLNSAPSQVWPRVRQFLNSNNLAVSSTDVSQGVIETAWLRFKDDETNRDKYRIRIEPGVQPDSTEVHVVHYQIPASDNLPDSVDWPEQSVSAERESWMVDELAASLAEQESGGAASLLAQTIGADDKIAVENNGEEPVLRMGLAMSRARASLNYALQQEGFTTWEEDSAARIYYVNYIDPVEGEGFFSRWFGGDDPKTSPYNLNEILTRLPVADTPANRELFPPIAFEAEQERLKDAPGLLVIVLERGGRVEVVIRNAYGEKLEPRKARDLLDVIRRNLI